MIRNYNPDTIFFKQRICQYDYIHTYLYVWQCFHIYNLCIIGVWWSYNSHRSPLYTQTDCLTFIEKPYLIINSSCACYCKIIILGISRISLIIFMKNKSSAINYCFIVINVLVLTLITDSLFIAGKGFNKIQSIELGSWCFIFRFSVNIQIYKWKKNHKSSLWW